MKQLFLALAIGFTAMGCNRYGQEEEMKKNCGCNSPILNSELNEKEFTGYFRLISDNKYLIFTLNKGGRPMAYVNTICNNNILPDELKNIKPDERIEVIYKGNVKKDCREFVPTIDWEYYYIDLIEIKIKK